MTMTLQQVTENIRKTNARLQLVKHNPLNIVETTKLEAEMLGHIKQQDQLLLAQKEAELGKKQQHAEEQRAFVTKEFDAAITVATKIDKTIAQFCSLLADLKEHVHNINNGRAHLAFVRNNADYEFHIRELMALGGFGKTQLLGGTPQKPPLAEQMRLDREALGNEL